MAIGEKHKCKEMQGKDFSKIKSEYQVKGEAPYVLVRYENGKPIYFCHYCGDNLN